MSRLSDDEDSTMHESLDSSPAPSTPIAPLRTFTSTSGLQHLDLQSPPQSQESTPYFERSHTSILKAFDGASEDAAGESSSMMAALMDGGNGNGSGSGSGSGSGMGMMMMGGGSSSNTREQGGVPPWMTKRSLEEQHQMQDKLVDREFTSRHLANIFDESDMKLPKD